MLHASTTSFGGFFALRVLLGQCRHMDSIHSSEALTDLMYRDVRKLCCTNPHPHHIHVLQEERAGAAPSMLCALHAV